MFSFIKDVIDLVRNPPGEAVAACEITPECRDEILDVVGPTHAKYVKNGDFFVEFENNTTIVPAKEFRKHYEFDGPIHKNELTRVRTTKPL